MKDILPMAIRTPPAIGVVNVILKRKLNGSPCLIVWICVSFIVCIASPTSAARKVDTAQMQYIVYS